MKKTIINELNIEGYKKLHEEMLKINNLEHRSVISTISMSVIGFVAPIMLSIALKEFIIVFLLLSLAIETCLLPYALISFSVLQKKKTKFKKLISKEYPDVDTEIDMLELQKKLEATKEMKVNNIDQKNEQKKLETIKEENTNKTYIDTKNTDEVVEDNIQALPVDQQVTVKPLMKMKTIK